MDEPREAIVELDSQMEEALERIRREVLRSPDLPLSDEHRERIARYSLQAAGPNENSVSLEVEVVRGGVSEEGSPEETVRRTVELTPQVVAESPGGLRYFVAWNHVARTFVVWFTPRSLASLRDGRRPDAPGRVLPLAHDQTPPFPEGDPS